MILSPGLSNTVTVEIERRCQRIVEGVAAVLFKQVVVHRVEEFDEDVVEQSHSVKAYKRRHKKDGQHEEEPRCQQNRKAECEW